MDIVAAGSHDAKRATPSGANVIPTPSGTPTPKPTPEPPKASTQEDAEKLAAKFRPWVYQIPSYQGAALRKSRDAVVVAETKPAAPAAGAPH